ncbi:MAG: hypothetical protein L6R41_000671 [Letrouitia leprolyta]|nr:MAG: hypothetical protein L6R41_000671 [Letrouitia leprolyta]
MSSYIDSHKADSDFRALDQKVSLLLTKNKEQAGKSEALEKKIRALEKRNEELEVRLKASEHNALSRHLNSLLPPQSHTALHPLHSIHTNTPLKNFPKHANDIKTMSSLDVATLLKELDADVTKVVNAGERKSRLKDVIGVGERGSVVEVVGGTGEGKPLDGVDGAKGEEKKKAPAPAQLPGKATGPPPGKVLPIQRKD